MATTLKFYIYGVAILQLHPRETFKYLGHQYGTLGITNSDIEDLRSNLEKVSKAALKLLQKLALIK